MSIIWQLAPIGGVVLYAASLYMLRYSEFQ